MENFEIVNNFLIIYFVNSNSPFIFANAFRYKAKHTTTQRSIYY